MTWHLLRPQSRAFVPRFIAAIWWRPIFGRCPTIERVHHWPGANGLGALCAGRPLCATRRNLRPRVAGRSTWARIEALLRNRAFATEYASARERWQTGEPAVFPPGTYWLHRFASVPVLET